MPKQTPIVFRNGPNYDYHFIIKELAEIFMGKFKCLGKNIEIYITFSVSIEKGVTRIDKNREEIKKLFRTDYILLIAQDLWQAHYQILSINLLKKFIKLNVETLICVVLNTQTLKVISLNTNVYAATKISKKSLMKT